MFYTFSQNNSGGFYDGPKYVCVEASSLEEAVSRALETGIVYFHGVSDGRDCGCCGDRWYPALFGEDLTETPTVYGRSLFDEKNYIIFYRNGETVEG